MSEALRRTTLAPLPGVRNGGLLGSRGVASLNHRLQALIPPGCGCPLPIIPRSRRLHIL
jgi:hypothetical protein